MTTTIPPDFQLRDDAPRPVGDALTMAWRNLLNIRRNPQLLVFATIQPVIFVLMFRYVFGGAIAASWNGQPVPYVDFLMPGIFVQTVTFGALTTGVGLAEDLQKGLIERFRSLPIARSAVLVGRTWADLVRNVFVVLLMAVVGLLVGWRINTNVFGFLGCLALVLAFAYSLSWVFAIVGLAAPDAEVPAWWADAGAGGGWFGAHGSQVIDQIRVTLGEFRSVTASVLAVAPRVPPWSSDDGFVVHFVMESGAVGIMQSTPSDRGPLLIETRVVGSTGTAWIKGVGATVKVADAAGTRTLDVPDDLRVGAAAAPPREVLSTTYEQMTGLGLDLGPYTRLAEHFLARIRGTRAPAGPQPATFADGVDDLIALDAMRRSASEGRTIAISS